MLGVSNLVNDVVFLVGAAAATAVATPFARRVALRTGFMDHPAANKFHARATPYLGGAAVFAAVLAGLIGAFVFRSNTRDEVAAIALGGAAVAAIGLVDDWRPIGPAPRLAVQALGALILWTGDVRLTPTGIGAVDLVITVFVVLALTNAVNLLDNMDGLAAGTVAVSALFLFIVSYWQGQRLVSLMAVVLAGACLGFLPYNFPPARIFLGDGGTLLLGFLLSAVVIKLNLNGLPFPTRASVPLLIVAVPLFDMTLVVLSRLRGARPVLRGGTDHSSHRLVALGASPRLAALLTYAAGASTGAAALWLLRARSLTVTWAVMAAAAAVGIGALALFEWSYERRAEQPSRPPRAADIAVVSSPNRAGAARRIVDGAG